MQGRMRGVTGCAVLTMVLAAGTASAQAEGPTLAEAKTALTAAQAAAATMNVNLGCAVVDTRGALVAAEKMDAAQFFTIDVARGKALISASFGAPSGNLLSFAASGIGTTLPGPAAPVWLQGAVPIRRGAVAIGAIGCSGSSGQNDEDGAKAGAATFE